MLVGNFIPIILFTDLSHVLYVLVIIVRQSVSSWAHLTDTVTTNLREEKERREKKRERGDRGERKGEGRERKDTHYIYNTHTLTTRKTLTLVSSQWNLAASNLCHCKAHAHAHHFRSHQHTLTICSIRCQSSPCRVHFLAAHRTEG